NNIWLYTLQMTAIRPLDVGRIVSNVGTTSTVTALAQLSARVAKEAAVPRTSFLPGGVAKALSMLGRVDTAVNAVVRTVTRLSPASALGYAAEGLDKVLRLPDASVSTLLDYATQI